MNFTIFDWLGREVDGVRSKNGVLALTNPLNNLIRPTSGLWPTSEILQKLYKSNQESAFDEFDRSALSKTLGFYSDLQSLHSEDALTWSVFGPIIYGEPSARTKFASALLNLINVPAGSISVANFWLWRRLPHPETLVPGGPEVDFGLQTDDVFLIGEAKWLSHISSRQGVERNEDQISLRQKFCKLHGQRLLPFCRRFVIVGLSIFGQMVPITDVKLGSVFIHTRDTTWDAVIGLMEHPHAEEEKKYLSWKRSHAKSSV